MKKTKNKTPSRVERIQINSHGNNEFNLELMTTNDPLSETYESEFGEPMIIHGKVTKSMEKAGIRGYKWFLNSNLSSFQTIE